MDFRLAKSHRDKLQARVDTASAMLRDFPATGPMGMVADEVKFSPAFQAASKEYKESFAALRAYNARFTKAFAKELRAERHARRTA